MPRGGGDGGTAAAAKKKKTKAKGKKKRRRGTVAICLSNCKYEVIEDCALDRGWRIIDDEDSTYPWNVYWTDTSVSTERVMALQSFQKINHFPGMSTLSRKAGLARNLTRMRAAFPKEFNFFPDTWTLPAEYQDFKDQFSRKGTKTFIVKPDHGCQVSPTHGRTLPVGCAARLCSCLPSASDAWAGAHLTRCSSRVADRARARGSS